MELTRFESKASLLCIHMHACVFFSKASTWGVAAVEEVTQSEVGDGVMEVLGVQRPLEWWDEGSGGGVMGDRSMTTTTDEMRTANEMKITMR